MTNFNAIVLAGGSSSRLGGIDKAGLEFAGSCLLDHVLHAVAGAERLVVVGPPRSTAVPVMWCREEPPGGGPVAALAAGMARIGAENGRSEYSNSAAEYSAAEYSIVLAVDLPEIAPAVPVLLHELAAGDHDVAVLTGADGQVNYLAAAWRTAALRLALSRVPSLENAAMRAVYVGRDVIAVPDVDGWGQDCDTKADLERARGRLAARTTSTHRQSEQTT